MNNWINIKDKMPELKHETDGNNRMSDPVLLWVLDTDKNGFPTVGNYSSYWGGWLAGQDGPLHVWGFEVTHWAEIKAPEATDEQDQTIV